MLSRVDGCRCGPAAATGGWGIQQASSVAGGLGGGGLRPGGRVASDAVVLCPVLWMDGYGRGWGGCTMRARRVVQQGLAGILLCIHFAKGKGSTAATGKVRLEINKWASYKQRQSNANQQT